ncbi:MAG: response regulator [Lachnospiraceae bacterium]|nr:response regulator [Lachnospiraceae bacterium]
MKNQNRSTAPSPLSEKIMLIAKCIFFTIIALSTIGFFVFNSMDTPFYLEYDDPMYLEDWRVTNPNGTVSAAGSSYQSGLDSNGEYVARTTLPDELYDDSYFCFIVGGDAYVYVDGVLRKEFVSRRDMIVPGGIVKRFYMIVPLHPSDANAELKIVREGTTRNGQVYQDAFLCTAIGLYNLLMENYALSLMLAEILLIFSSVLFIISIAMSISYKSKIAMTYGSFSIVVISGWIISNSYLYPFIYHHYHIDGIMNYLYCMLIPFSLLFYLDALQKGRYRKIMIGVCALSFLSLFLWSGLHFSGILSFPRALPFINIILGIQILVVMGVIVMDFFKKKIKEYIYTAIGFVGFLACAFSELVLLNFFVTLHDELPVLLGLAVLLTMSVVQQIHDLKQLSDDRRKAIALSEAKTKFLASMSHEIRTPINSILGMNEMILRENKDPEIDEYASSVKSAGNMLLMLVNDVLDFSKIEAGKLEITDANYSFSLLLHDIMPMLKERADEKSLALGVNFKNEIPDGQVSDEFRIKQILINLINNAIKYTDTGSVKLDVSGNYISDEKFMLELSVKDTGRGISEEGQANLFEAFTRADLKKNGSIEGTGLGLAIVKNIIDSMGGSIDVISTLGEGSDFIVKIPVGVYDKTPALTDYEKATHKTHVEKDGGDYTAPDAKVLAVDDNNSNLRIVSLFLKRVGIIPDTCDSGLKAFELCKEKTYDVILLDHMMPGKDGIETLSLIRSSGASVNKTTPAIVLTANAVAGSRKIYMDAGFADYLTKPINSGLLEKTVREYLPPSKVITTESGEPKQEPEQEDTSGNGTTVMTFAPAAPKDTSLRYRMSTVDGLDYDTAMRYVGGDEEALEEIVKSITEDCPGKVELLKKLYENGDLESYSREAHAIKGLAAMIGISSFSERAKKHEFAGREGDSAFIAGDIDDFLSTYKDISDKMMGR